MMFIVTCIPFDDCGDVFVHYLCNAAAVADDFSHWVVRFVDFRLAVHTRNLGHPGK